MWPKPLRGGVSEQLETSEGKRENVPAVVAGLATTEATLLESTGTGLGAVSADVTVLAASVALAGRSTVTTGVSGGSFGAFSRDVAGLTAL